jgi:glyoxylase-like metal-dependent hydrolase (beta-lactamase superfamily II)
MKTSFVCLLCSILASNIIFSQNNEVSFSHKLGDFEIYLLSETQSNGDKKILIGATPEILNNYAPNGTFPNAVNAFLIKTPNHNILVDTGFGNKLFDNLRHLNVSPEDIDIILITHMHGDHIGGLVKNDKNNFPNAKVYISKKEYEYWLPKADGNVMLNRLINIYSDKIELFTSSDINFEKSELLPGISAISAFGHTPGHVMFLIEFASEKILIWGDVTHAMAIQIPHPEIAVTYDINPDDAISSRLKVLKYVSENKIPIAGMHIAFPGMGTIESIGNNKYEFIPFK